MSAIVHDLGRFKTWKVGDITVTRVLEMPPLTLDPSTQLKTTSDVVAAETWLQPHFATAEGMVHGHIQAFVVEAGGRTILVDTCVGNGKHRHLEIYDMLDNPFLERLSDAGFPVERVDTVLCTHLHLDHCGWNTRLVDGEWVPTFPNAEYLFARVDYEYSKDGVKTPGPAAAYDASYEDSVKPIVDAGLARIIEFDHVVAEGVSLVPTPGHSPGHCSVLLRSGGRQALITGDIAHHPIQVCQPDICSRIDWDEAKAIETRNDVFGRYAGTDTLILGTHFADPTGVTIFEHSGTWRVREAPETC